MPKKNWEVEWVEAGSQELGELLGDGWEPFAATDSSDGPQTVWVRREVRGTRDSGAAQKFDEHGKSGRAPVA